MFIEKAYKITNKLFKYILVITLKKAILKKKTWIKFLFQCKGRTDSDWNLKYVFFVSYDLKKYRKKCM